MGRHEYRTIGGAGLHSRVQQIRMLLVNALCALLVACPGAKTPSESTGGTTGGSTGGTTGGATNYSIGGSVTGLSGMLQLTNNGADTLSLTANGSFSFAALLATGANYNVAVASQPNGETCAVASGSGTVSSSNVTNVAVSCIPNSPVSMSIRVPTLSSGDSEAVVVTLAQPAGPGGVQISLASTDSAILLVPVSVTVPQGNTQGYFGVGAEGAGTASITATMADSSSVASVITVLPRDFTAFASSSAVVVGQTSIGSLELRSPAPSAGATLSVAASDSALVNVLTPTITVPAGQTQAQFSFQGLATGNSTITVSGLTSEQGTQSLKIRVLPALGSTTASSGQLINQALAAGQLTPQQALVYQTLARFGSADLPAQYQGIPNPREFSDTSTALLSQLSTLSPDQQAAVAPYLVPPISAGSWQQPAAVHTATRARSLFSTRATGSSSEASVAAWATLVLPHFKIWYRTDSPNGLYTADEAAQAALNVAAWVEYSYTALHDLLQIDLLSDAGQANNGGDGLFDIYIVLLGDDAVGATQVYHDACNSQASYVLIDVRNALSSRSRQSRRTARTNACIPERVR